jgi:hypothetical protein
MKRILEFKILFIYGLLIAFIFTTLISCKSKKKCPDFTNVGGKVKVDKNGLAKKKKVKPIKSSQGY